MNTPVKSLQQLRIISLAEGLSYLLLLFVSMPLKYIFHYPKAVLYNGYLHGFLFVLLALSILYTWYICHWKFGKALLAGICSLIPFGAFWFDRVLKKEIASHNFKN